MAHDYYRRSLGQGNVFTGVCVCPQGEGVCLQGGLPRGGSAPSGVWLGGVHPRGIRKVSGTHPTGMLSCV